MTVVEVSMTSSSIDDSTRSTLMNVIEEIRNRELTRVRLQHVIKLQTFLQRLRVLKPSLRS